MSDDQPKHVVNRTPWDAARDPEAAPTQVYTPPLVEDVSEPDGANALRGEFIGRRGRIFWLAVRTGILTVLTLGLYRFWMKTRLRRWYWSSVRVDGTPGEYVGDPLEKLLGFLIAVVFLAFYIGIVNLLLMFASFSLFQGNFAAYLLSFIGVVPLWFYASYRARRYVLARTRWRGIRFGLEPGAWGYAGRALMHWALAILTLGALWPRLVFKLEQYRTDRTWFGDVKFEQGGRWTMLYRPLLHFALAAVVSAAAAGAVYLGSEAAVLVLFVLPLWLLYGFAYYRARTWERLTSHKQAGGIRFRAEPRVWRIFWIYSLGYGLTGLASSVFLIPLGLVFALTFGAAQEIGVQDLGLPDVPRTMLNLVGVAAYFSMFLVWSALRHAFVTMPLWRHFAETLTVLDPDVIAHVAQRPRDESSQAEGFAEALDVGAAI